MEGMSLTGRKGTDPLQQAVRDTATESSLTEKPAALCRRDKGREDEGEERGRTSPGHCCLILVLSDLLSPAIPTPSSEACF